jgi:hypothetical protein
MIRRKRKCDLNRRDAKNAEKYREGFGIETPGQAKGKISSG